MRLCDTPFAILSLQAIARCEKYRCWASKQRCPRKCQRRCPLKWSGFTCPVFHMFCSSTSYASWGFVSLLFWEPVPSVQKRGGFLKRLRMRSVCVSVCALERQNCLQWGRSNLVDPSESPKIRLLNRDFGNILSIIPRKNSKTQSSLNFL